MLAGSVVRGEATDYSDLDLVVVFDRLENAKRRSFEFEGWPVEAFLHDPSTLEFFFLEVDRPTGVPSLLTMITEGLEIPDKTQLGLQIKDLASRLLEEGPIPWGQTERENSRYAITNMIEDVRDPRNLEEFRIVVSDLYSAVADHFLRSRNQWSAKGKSIPRRLMSLDPQFHSRLAEAFEAAFTENDVEPLIHLCEHVLEPDGGFLFEGYVRDAPKGWRTSDS